MSSSKKIRALGSIALATFLFAGLPGLALAAGAKPMTPDGSPNIKGKVTALVGGAAISGIQVSVIGTIVGQNGGNVVTDAGGHYVLPVYGSDSYELNFTDPANKYLYGSYYTSDPGDFSIGTNNHTDVAVATDDVTGYDVQMTVGLHIKGKATGPATPANGLYGLDVMASKSSPNYNAHTATGTDGTYTLTVPSGQFSVSFSGYQHFYVDPCGDGNVTPAGSCHLANVVAADVTVNAAMVLREGVALTVAPADSSVSAGSAMSFTATLALTDLQAKPAYKGSGIDMSNVSAATTFTIDPSGHCTGKNCTPPAIGDYTVTGSYGGITGQTALHSVKSAPTPSTTSTEGPTGGQDGFPLLILLLGLAASAVMVLGLKRRVAVRI